MGGGDCSFTAPGGRLCNPQYQDLINPHLLFTASNKSFRIGSPLLFARVGRNERFAHLQLLPLFYTCVLFFRLCRDFRSSRQYLQIFLYCNLSPSVIEILKKLSRSSTNSPFEKFFRVLDLTIVCDIKFTNPIFFSKPNFLMSILFNYVSYKSRFKTFLLPYCICHLFSSLL